MVGKRIKRAQQPKKLSAAWDFSSGADWGHLIEEESK